MLKTKTIARRSDDGGIEVSFEGDEGAGRAATSTTSCWSRSGAAPNGKKIGADKAGVAVTDRGFIHVDKQMRTNVPHIFAIGDIVGQPMLAHKAVHEAHVAAEVGARREVVLRRAADSVGGLHRSGSGVGRQDRRRSARRRASSTARRCSRGPRRAARSPTAATRASPSCCSTKKRIACIGGGIVGTHAGDLISEVCLAVEMGCDPTDIGKTIHPHPTLGESIGMAAEVFEGVCTDLPPAKKK